jgi:hypothetical protein
MPVIMKGGTSGCAHDYLPDVSRPYDNQVPQDTANNSGKGPDVNFGGQPSGNRATSPGTDEFYNPPVPSGGTPDDSAL